MISLTYSSVDYYLFWHRADESRPQKLELYMPGKIRSGPSEREARPPLATALRVSQYQFTTVLAGYEPRDLTAALKAKTTEKILVPFWPAAQPQSDYVSGPMDGGLNISFDVDDVGWSDFSAYEIHAGRTPSSHPITANTWTAPLLVGRFTEEPQPDLETDELQDLTVTFEEDSQVAYALDLDAQSFTQGPALEGTKYLFPLRHDFAGPARSGGTEINLQTRIIGQGREATVEYYNGAAYENPRMRFPFGNLSEACQLMRFFQDRKGVSENFWLPGYVAEARLVDHVASTDSSIELDTVAPFTDKPYICLQDKDNVVPLEVNSIGSPFLGFASQIGTAFRYDETSLCKLLLVRFAKMRLQLTWDGATGEAEIEFKELVPEYAEPAGETIGTTLGSTPRECSLYEFTDGNGNFWRLTSFESDLTYNSQNWVKHPITHGDIRTTITLDDAVDLRAEPVSGSPLLGFNRQEIPRLWVTIYKGEASGAVASNVSQVFTGEILDCPERGMLLQAKAILYGADLDRQPRGRFQIPCWYKLFGSGCTLLRSDWIFSAEFSDVGTAGWPYTFELDNVTRDNLAALPGGFGFVNWLAWGTLEWGDQRITIQSSTAINLGKITVTLAGDPDPFPSVTDPLKVVPSCDGKWVTCKGYNAGTNPRGKFGNHLNWGGHHVARGNFSLIKVSTSVSGGKK